MTTVISIENLSKQYRLGVLGSRTIQGDLQRWWANLRGKPDPLLEIGQEHLAEHEGEFIWALRNINLQLEQGEVLGIIGQNGAGKSTLLKIISNLTAPTTGVVKIKGRIGSLLEVGTGFNPELTGRDNVFLNGAILGMTRAEIQRKFDEIVDFSDVEKFIDTPVKRYSSGMRVRLAFAVAAHLDPEILVVDEVLAVGDAAFQRKCLMKMGDVSRIEGRTVLFVSHNMVAVQSLCNRAIWLEGGKIVDDGPENDVVSNYLKTTLLTITEQVWTDMRTAPGNEEVRLYRACVKPERGSPKDLISMQTPFVVEVDFNNLVADSSLGITLLFYTDQGVIAFGSALREFSTWQDQLLPAALFRSACHVPGDFLNSGRYRVALLVTNEGSVIYRHDDILSFEVVDTRERIHGWYGKRAGVVRPLLKWSMEQLDSNLV
jgi:lipopolysaccharide transport system ATP-binding protein